MAGCGSQNRVRIEGNHGGFFGLKMVESDRQGLII